MAFNARHRSEEPAKTVVCQELLQTVLTPLIFHEGDFDPRGESLCFDRFLFRVLPYWIFMCKG